METLNYSARTSKVKVLVVDDSALMRQLLTSILQDDPDLEVVGSAEDPYDAREKIKTLSPDVITLDINMPKMDGIFFLEKIMSLRPMPVVMVSTLTEKGAKETFDALSLGAVDYVTKPTTDIHKNFTLIADEIRTKVKQAAKANVKGRQIAKSTKCIGQATVAESQKMPSLVVIGSSTGGVEALTEIVSRLPKNCPPIIIVQHMPPKFTTSFADRLNRTYQPTICEATHGQIVKKNSIYLAPGDFHVTLKKQGYEIVIELNQTDNVNGHRPSVDVMFHSVAGLKQKDVVGIILTGMGKDGAQGMKAMKEAGVKTFGQNVDSCLVYGMPKAAKELDAVDKELPLKKMADAIMGNIV